MIHAAALSEETQKISNIIKNVIENSKENYKEQIKSFSDDIYANLMESIDSWFSYNCFDTYRENVAYEVRKIITALLAGEQETIKQLDIVSEYTFDKLHEIRMKIWKTCSFGIEESIIKQYQEKIDYLEKEVKFYRQRDYQQQRSNK